MSVQEDRQLGLEEVVINDPETEEKLREWFELGDKVKPLNSSRKKAKGVVLERLKDHLDGEGTLRLGPYTITVKPREQSERNFTVPAGIRVSIKRDKTGETTEIEG